MLKISQETIQDQELEHKLKALQTLHPPKSAKTLARVLVGMGVFLFICLFLPWQQNIQGTGTVTALTPQDRPQTVQTAIAGRIISWNVQEGQFVKAKDTILTLSEIKDEYFDPQLLTRLSEQVQAKEEVIAANRNKVTALAQNIVALGEGLQLKLQQAQNKLRQARYKLVMDSTDYEAEKINFQIANRQFTGGENMYRNGLVSLVEYEKRKLKLQETNAKLVSMENKVLAAKAEVINARIELNSIAAEYAKEIAKANSDRSSALSYLSDAEGELSKLRNKLSSVEVRVQQRAILAPQDGYVVRALKAGIGETIKEGEAVVTVQPATPQKAVELYINAMDVPLISKGRHVRLEFDGWPALQFSGWPSVSVGTFAGRVAVIDYVNSKAGKYRILVTPDHNQEPWPEQLRLGSGVYGWTMLNDVPIWYEIWRQLNGFPPSLNEEPSDGEGGPKKMTTNRWINCFAGQLLPLGLLYRFKVVLLSASFLGVLGESFGQGNDNSPGSGKQGVPGFAGMTGPGRKENQKKLDAGQVKVFTGRDFFAQVLQYHPVARQAALLSDFARQELRIARGDFDPKLFSDFALKEYKQSLYYRNWTTELKVPVWIGELKGGYERNVGARVNPDAYTPDAGLAYAGVSVPLPISQGFFIDARRATLRQAQIFRDIAEADRVKEINKLLLSAAKDYWYWYYARNEYELMTEAYQLADVRFQAVKGRLVQGDVAPIDSIEAQTILQDRYVQLKQAQVGLTNARLILSNYMWGEDDTPLEIPQDFVPADFDTNQALLGETSLNALLERARLMHPELRKLNFKINQLEVEQRFRRDLLKPNIRVDYNLLSAAPVQASNVDMAFLRNNYKVGANFSFPLFLRKERGKLQQTIIKLEQNTFERSQAGREIENGIRAVYNELKTTEELLRVQQTMVENYLRLRDGELQKFENGESSLFLINSRETRYIEAQIKLISLRSKYEQQKAELLWSAGLSDWEGVN